MRRLLGGVSALVVACAGPAFAQSTGGGGGGVPANSPAFTGTVTLPDNSTITSSGWGAVPPPCVDVGPGATVLCGVNPSGAFSPNAFNTVEDVEKTVTATASGQQGMLLGVGMLHSPAADSASEYWAQSNELATGGTHNFSGEHIAIFGEFDHLGSGNFSYHGSGVDGEAYADNGNVTGQGIISGVQGEAGTFCSNNCTVTQINGMLSTIQRAGNATVTDGADYYAAGTDEEGGTEVYTTLSGLEIASFTVASTNNAILIKEAAGANNYGIHETGTAQNSFAGTMNELVNYQLNSVLLFSATAPTLTGSGLGTSPSITGSSAAMDITVGSSPSAANFTITFPTASHGWACNGSDITTQSTTVFVLKQVGGSTTTCVMEEFSDVAVAAAPVASDHLRVTATAY